MARMKLKGQRIYNQFFTDSTVMNGRNSGAGCWLRIWFQVERGSPKRKKRGWKAKE